MAGLTIQSCYPKDITIISNIFLDKYMLDANGEFVKIYLYLLRATGKENDSFSLSSIADTLNCTEGDISRALNYWQKAGVLELVFDVHKKPSSITFLPLSADYSQTAATAEPVPTAAALPSPVKSSGQHNTASASDRMAAEASCKAAVLTPARVKKLKENEDIMQLLFIASQYMGKTLTPTETSRILYFYEELHFSTDLIEYLIEYCVSKGSSSIRYMETVAASWAQQQITSVATAKKETNTYNKNYFTILKALGIKGRNPIDAEATYMDIWLKEYAFTLDLISEACSRTVMQTKQPSFQYADGILKSWHKKDVKSMSDVEALDKKHNDIKAAKQSASADKKPQIRQPASQFNDFSQREYDYNRLEEQLLNK